MNLKKICSVSVVICCLLSLHSADLVLKDGRVLQNYRVKDVAGENVTIEYSRPDGSLALEKTTLSQLPPEVAFLFGASIPVVKKSHPAANTASGSSRAGQGNIQRFVQQLKNVPANDKAERLRVAEDIKQQLESDICSKGIQDEFSVVWVDADGLLVKAMRDNGTLKAEEYIFVHGAGRSSGKLRLTIYPTGIRRQYGSFGKVKIFALKSADASAVAVKSICAAAGICDLMNPTTNVIADNSRSEASPAAALPEKDVPERKINPINQAYDYDSGITKGSWRDQRTKRRNSDYDPHRTVSPSGNNNNDSFSNYHQDRRNQAIDTLKQAKNVRQPTEQVTNSSYNKPQLTATSGVRESEAAVARQSYADYRNSSVRANEAAADRQSYSDYRSSSVRENETAATRQSYSDIRNTSVRGNETAATRQSYSDIRNASVRENETAATRQSYSDIRNASVRENETAANRQSYSDIRKTSVRENETATNRQSYSDVRKASVRENESSGNTQKYSDYRNKVVRENESVAEPKRYSDVANRKVVEEPKIKYAQEVRETDFKARKQTGNCQGSGAKRIVCEPKVKPEKKTKMQSSPIVKRDKRKIFSYDHVPAKFRK